MKTRNGPEARSNASTGWIRPATRGSMPSRYAAVKVGAMTKADRNSDQADDHGVRRRRLGADGRAQERQHHHDTRERGHHHEDGGRERQHGHKRDELERALGDAAALAEIER